MLAGDGCRLGDWLDVPTSLFAIITDTRIVSGASRAQARQVDAAVLVDIDVGDPKPAALQPLAGPQHGVMLDVGGDKVVAIRRRANATPLMARLSLSVPPLVKRTSLGRQLSTCATVRAIRRARGGHAAMAVQARRVAPPFPQVWEHRLEDTLVEGGSGGVVKVR